MTARFGDAVLWNERRPSASKAVGAISFCATACRRVFRRWTFLGAWPRMQG